MTQSRVVSLTSAVGDTRDWLGHGSEKLCQEIEDKLSEDRNCPGLANIVFVYFSVLAFL